MKRLGLFLVLYLSLVSFSFGENLRVHFIDVGQGSAVLLESATATVLVDAGRHGGVLEYLSRIGITEIDLAIATHAHADHIGGFIPIFDAMSVRGVWYNGQVHTTLTFERFIDAILASDATYHEPARGESVSFGNLIITVLHPAGSAADYTGHLHDMNIVLRAVYGEFSVVLTGDAEISTEHEILKHGMNVAATVLKLGHHGSRTSSSVEFVRAVTPAAVVYQAGIDNRYGHPHREVRNRMDAFDEIHVFGSDVHGTILFETDGHSWSVTTERQGTVFSGPAARPRRVSVDGYHEYHVYSPRDAREKAGSSDDCESSPVARTWFTNSYVSP